MALGLFKYLFLLIFFEFDIFREIFFLQTKPKDYLSLSDVATIQELMQYFQRFHLWRNLFDFVPIVILFQAEILHLISQTFHIILTLSVKLQSYLFIDSIDILIPLSVFLLLKFKFIERIKKLELRILKRFGRKKFSCYTEKDTKLIATNIIRKGVFSTSFRWYCTILSVAILKYIPHSLTSNNRYLFIFTIFIWIIEMFAAMSKREIIWMYSILLSMCLSPWAFLLSTHIESIDGTNFLSMAESIIPVFQSIIVDQQNEIYMVTSIYALILLCTMSAIHLLSIIFETVLVHTIIARIKFLQRLFS